MDKQWPFYLLVSTFSTSFYRLIFLRWFSLHLLLKLTSAWKHRELSASSVIKPWIHGCFFFPSFIFLCCFPIHHSALLTSSYTNLTHVCLHLCSCWTHYYSFISTRQYACCMLHPLLNSMCPTACNVVLLALKSHSAWYCSYLCFRGIQLRHKLYWYLSQHRLVSLHKALSKKAFAEFKWDDV